MKVVYDPEVDILRIILSNAAIEESDEQKRVSSLTTIRTATSSAWRSWTPPNAWKIHVHWNTR